MVFTDEGRLETLKAAVSIALKWKESAQTKVNILLLHVFSVQCGRSHKLTIKNTTAVMFTNLDCLFISKTMAIDCTFEPSTNLVISSNP